MLFVVGCGDDSSAPAQVDPVRFVTVEDVANEGDGRDMQVRFLPPVESAGVAEYRIAVAPAADAGALTAAELVGLSGSRVTVVAAAGTDPLVVTLGADVVDTSGAAITEGVAYSVVVASVGEDPANAAIAAPSAPVTLAATAVTITYLGNDGVMIDDGVHKVVIDGLHAAAGSWVELPVAERTALERGEGMYADIDVVMVTHNHGDHYSPMAIGRFLDNHPAAALLGPPQVTANLAGRPQIMPVSPSRGAQQDVAIDGLAISVLHVRHFDQFGNDFSSVENYGYLIEIGGLRLLHFGDVDYSEANLSSFDLASANIDIVFLPTFNTLLSQASADVIAQYVAPGHVVAMHFQQSQVGTEAAAVDDLYPGATKFTQALQVLRQ